MSTTPRTDAAIILSNLDEVADDCVRASFARELECELAQRPSVDRMVETFLQWRLPESVCADGCTTRTDWPHPRYGTNLLTHTEAKQMIEHLLLKK